MMIDHRNLLVSLQMQRDFHLVLMRQVPGKSLLGDLGELQIHP